jgi:mannose-6-phosphate isomerase-like protein (cupin superfamily)
MGCLIAGRSVALVPLPLAQTALSALNHVLRQQDWARDRLRAHTGRTVRMVVESPLGPVASEARIAAGNTTQRHFHRVAEEFYFILDGTGLMEIDGTEREVGPGDAVLIPPGAWHTIRATRDLRFLCCCAPPYSHEDTYFA